MEYMNSMPVFTIGQAAALVGGSRYAKVYLHRLQKRRLISRLKRGFYTVYEDPVIFATHLYYPSYLSLWYAFQHYGTTTQLPKNLEVMTHKKDTIPAVDFIRTRYLWGYKTIRYSGFEVFMADLEKAVIDAVITERVPVDEIKAAIIQCDKNILEEYVLRTDLGTMKRVGYIAEETGFFLENVHDRIIKDRNYVHFSLAKKKNRWRVVND